MYQEIKSLCDEINGLLGEMHESGLLQVVQHHSKVEVGKDASFNFLHFTMQDFLATVHA